MEFLWNDGGRSACGFVGLTSDCVARAIAIGTGAAYRDVYNQLGEAAQKSPRRGLPVEVFAPYLAERGWQHVCGEKKPFDAMHLPKGVVVVHLIQEGERKGHLCAVIDHVVHDTWNAADDDGYVIENYWIAPAAQSLDGSHRSGAPAASGRSELTQQEFDKILRRLRALDNTASNSASTEGEKHNALRMMQDLMLRHNLSRDDIEGNDNVEGVQFARVACPLNSSKAHGWEVALGNYVTEEIFPTVQWYRDRKGHRTLFWFYGPWSDVQNCIAIFRELLVTIATSAYLNYGSYSRGSGASYCEGYVSGLPTAARTTDSQASAREESSIDGSKDHEGRTPSSNRSLVQMRTIALHDAARDWLDLECNVRLTTRSRWGRVADDPAATSRGKQHGASHNIDLPGRPKRLTE